MTDQTPIERAAAAIDENYNPDQAPILAAMFQDYAHAVFESIDTDELRDEIAGWPIDSGYYATLISVDEAHDIALAVKNWLTGKDTQQ